MSNSSEFSTTLSSSNPTPTRYTTTSSQENTTYPLTKSFGEPSSSQTENTEVTRRPSVTFSDYYPAPPLRPIESKLKHYKRPIQWKSVIFLILIPIILIGIGILIYKIIINDKDLHNFIKNKNYPLKVNNILDVKGINKTELKNYLNTTARNNGIHNYKFNFTYQEKINNITILIKIFEPCLNDKHININNFKHNEFIKIIVNCNIGIKYGKNMNKFWGFHLKGQGKDSTEIDVRNLIKQLIKSTDFFSWVRRNLIINLNSKINKLKKNSLIR